jgi:hypothetical protein
MCTHVTSRQIRETTVNLGYVMTINNVRSAGNNGAELLLCRNVYKLEIASFRRCPPNV